MSCSRALRKENTDRYQSAAEMLSDLQAIPIQHSPSEMVASELSSESAISVVDYLFVDMIRLQGYLEQLETRESTQTHRSGRPLSVHERVRRSPDIYHERAFKYDAGPEIPLKLIPLEGSSASNR